MELIALVLNKGDEKNVNNFSKALIYQWTRYTTKCKVQAKRVL